MPAVLPDPLSAPSRGDLDRCLGASRECAVVRDDAIGTSESIEGERIAADLAITAACMKSSSTLLRATSSSDG
jgi:hypothetical protein